MRPYLKSLHSDVGPLGMEAMVVQSTNQTCGIATHIQLINAYSADLAR